jgi:outer membrane receptor protein involved in Fe transport
MSTAAGRRLREGDMEHRIISTALSGATVSREPPSSGSRRAAGHRVSSSSMCRLLLAAVLLTAPLLSLGAGTTGVLAAEARGGDDEGDDDKSAEQEDTGESEEDEPVDSEIVETVVVSASATGESVRDAPAAVSVLAGDELEARPADLLADQLRRVPGVNVVQFSARDVNISSRQASGGINNSTLALSDGRNLYLDFLGFIMWEFAPRDPELVDRVEVVRGPASSIWGANAVGGVVHVITKSPRDTLGGNASVAAGNYSMRNVEARESFLVGPWAMRVSAGYYESDPFDRPTEITNFCGDTIDPDLGLIEDGFNDSGTEQPRVDIRVDRTGSKGGEWILQGGWGQTRGWIATGLGPFDIDSSTGMSYVQARHRRGLFETQIDLNYFDGGAVNLINALPFDFTSGTAHAALRGQHLLGGRGVLGWGVEATRSEYDLTIAPDGDERTIGSVFAEVDVGLVSQLRLVAGGRLDHFKETIGSVFSPRVALRYKPGRNHTVRVAAGRAFRAPTVVETHLLVPSIPVAILDWAELDAEFLPPELAEFGLFVPMAELVCGTRPDNCGAPEGEIPDYVAATAAQGDEDLEEERTDSLELGYAGRVGRFDLSATVYRTESRGGIDFPQVGSYGLGPDGLPGTADDILLPTDPDGDGIEEAPPVDTCQFNIDGLPPFDELCAEGEVPYNQFLSILLDGEVPSLFRYQNGAETENEGFELGLSWTSRRALSAWLNYSYQAVPVSDGVKMTDRIDNVIAEKTTEMDLDGDGLIADTSEFVNIPAANRASLGVQLDRRRWSAAVTFDYVDETFWQDVLTSDFWGWVDDYSLVGVRGSWRWPGLRLGLTAQITNLLDEKIRQHILGDIIDRRASIALSYHWGDGRSRSAGP